jgi:hypothetical protein
MAMVVNSHGGRTVSPSPEAAYPHPGRTVYVRPVNCGFDKQDFAVLGGVPETAGVWSGPAYVLTRDVLGIRPDNGPGMLRFLGPRTANNPAAGRDSAVWQLIDLRHVRELLSPGDVDLVASAKFNRISAANRATTFHLTVAAFRGPIASAATLWSSRDQSALAVSHRELVSDNNPATWEMVEVSGKLPADAEFVVLELRAVCPDGVSSSMAFPGHFADLSDIYLSAPMRGSLVSHSP